MSHNPAHAFWGGPFRCRLCANGIQNAEVAKAGWGIPLFASGKIALHALISSSGDQYSCTNIGMSTNVCRHFWLRALRMQR